MSDDIDRLKTLLEDLRCIRDGMADTYDVANDVIAAVLPVECETDVEGYRHLQNITMDIRAVQQEIVARVEDIAVKIVDLAVKARL